ncbi:MAG: hypothetical protein JJU12_02300 [Chlamydiales bacterium]|nr:hypothetical protein [Chlamydiales bacterium]
MRNKVLIVDSDSGVRQQLEQILQEVVEDGGELFFADKREDGLAIIAKEHPQLVFLDAPFVGKDEDEWMKEGVHLVIMRDRRDTQHKSEDFVLKPLRSHQILEKCRGALKRESAPPIPPM